MNRQRVEPLELASAVQYEPLPRLALLARPPCCCTKRSARSLGYVKHQHGLPEHCSKGYACIMSKGNTFWGRPSLDCQNGLQQPYARAWGVTTCLMHCITSFSGTTSKLCHATMRNVTGCQHTWQQACGFIGCSMQPPWVGGGATTSVWQHKQEIGQAAAGIALCSRPNAPPLTNRLPTHPPHPAPTCPPTQSATLSRA